MVNKIYKAFYCFHTFHNALDKRYSMKIDFFNEPVFYTVIASQLSIGEQTNNRMPL